MPEELRKDIITIRQQIQELNQQLQNLGIALQGSSSLDVVGIFQRLKDAERVARECDEKQNLKIEKVFAKMDHLEAEIDGKFDLLMERMNNNNTKLSEQLMEFHTWKSEIASYLNIFKSKYFWRAVGVALGLIAFSKTFNAIVEEIRKLFN